VALLLTAGFLLWCGVETLDVDPRRLACSWAAEVLSCFALLNALAAVRRIRD
jgi:hypothetical protein